MATEIFFDGLCEPQPGGIGTYGYVIYSGGEKIREHCGFIGKGKGMTNNIAEYTAVVEALKWAQAHGLLKGEAIIKGDSQLVIRQLQGSYRIKSKTSKKFFPVISKITAGENVRYEWVPREENSEADCLSKRAHEDYAMKMVRG